jgi:hypothetical protein
MQMFGQSYSRPVSFEDFNALSLFPDQQCVAAPRIAATPQMLDRPCASARVEYQSPRINRGVSPLPMNFVPSIRHEPNLLPMIKHRSYRCLNLYGVRQTGELYYRQRKQRRSLSRKGPRRMFVARESSFSITRSDLL